MLSGEMLSKHPKTASKTLLSMVEAKGILLSPQQALSSGPYQDRTGSQLDF